MNPRQARGALVWGNGTDKVSLFRDSSPEEERAQLDEVLAWQRTKFDAGYGAISYPVEYGGAGLPRSYEVAFRRLERGYAIPAVADVASISLEIEAPTILTLGTDEQKRRWLANLRRGDLLCCQLFSEPAWVRTWVRSRCARSATVTTGSSTVRRCGPRVRIRRPRLLSFAGPRRTPTTSRRSRRSCCRWTPPVSTIRPLRQMTGGACFNEVFFDNVRVSDADRIGEVGAGWNAMMTTLGFERASAAEGGGGAGPDVIGRMIMTAQHQGMAADPLVRQALADVYAVNRMRSWTSHRAAAKAKAGAPGPEGSISKLTMTRWMQSVSEARHHLARTVAGRRHRRVGNLRLVRVRLLLPGRASRRWHGRDPEEHHRRTRAGIAARTAAGPIVRRRTTTLTAPAAVDRSPQRFRQPIGEWR